MKYYFLMHFIIFIWGFTAVLGALISLSPELITWYRLGLAVLFLYAWKKLKKINYAYTWHDIKHFIWNGLLIGLHWWMFFSAIKWGNVSVTLVTLSVSSLFVAFLEPFFFKRRIRWYEVLFGMMVIGGLYIIFQVNEVSWKAVVAALAAAFFGSLFSVNNGLLIKRYHPVDLSLYQLLSAFGLLTLIILIRGQVNEIFTITWEDLLWLVILSSICTAYAFTASIEILRKINPFTLILSINLEPVYGIILALIILGEKEKMSPSFYLGSIFILFLVILNGVISLRRK